MNINYLGVNKLSNEGNASFEGLALDIKDKLKMLQDAEIDYFVSPNFPYEIQPRKMKNELTCDNAYKSSKLNSKMILLSLKKKKAKLALMILMEHISNLKW